MSFFRRILLILGQWKLLLSVLTPLLLMVIPFVWKGQTGKEPYAAYMILLMIVYWMSECVPLPVTALLPVTLLPLFGILSTEKVCSLYLQDSVIFLMGGVIIALAVEYSNLHTRIAIKVILTIGVKIPRLLFGIMFTAMFLSMWMNNTSTTAMMIPIVNAIMDELRSKMLEQARSNRRLLDPDPTVLNLEKTNGNGVDVSDMNDEDLEDMELSINEKIKKLKIMFLIATANASNIGGTGVITGSPTNIVALDLVRRDAESENCPEECKKFLEIGFIDWMAFNTPPVLLTTFLAWGYLQLHFIGVPASWKFWKASKAKEMHKTMAKMEENVHKNVLAALRLKYAELGPISLHEIGVSIIFGMTVLLWIMKDPQFIPGWESLPIFKQSENGKSYIKESTPTFLMCMFLFMFPKESSYYKNFSKGGLGQGMKDTLLNWKVVRQNFPFGVFLLLGGGSAMATGSRLSGLNKLLEETLKNSEALQAVPPSLLLILMLCIITVITTLASNIACASIMIPVLLALSYVKNFHPMYMVIAASSICSYAFMLPVSTPPNAIAYGSAPEMKVSDMAKAGFMVNVFGIIVLYVSTHTVGNLIFNFDSYNNECASLS